MKQEYRCKIKQLGRFARIALVLLIAACGSQGAAPDFLTPEPSVGAPGEQEGPAVNDELAQAAWEQRLVYHVGPVDLPPQTDARSMLEKPLTLNFQTDEPIWVTAFVPRVIDASGAALPAELLHSAIIVNLHEENPLCAEGGSGGPIFFASSLVTEVDLPQGFGYPILATDPLEARVVLQNTTDQSYAGVSFELTLVARPMNEFTNLADVKPILFEMSPCDHLPLDVEPGSFAERSATYQPAIKGRIVLADGVLTDYGAAIELAAGKASAPFWRAEALLDELHRVLALAENPYADPKGVAVGAEDPITLSVTYDNTSQAWLHAAVAGAMVYLAPDE
jgi:hypothetical protein